MKLFFRAQVAAALLLAACNSRAIDSQTNVLPQSGVFSNRATQQFLNAASGRDTLVSYALPMVSGERPAAATTVVVQGIAAYGSRLYAVTNNNTDLSEFPLPLVNGEKPSISIGVAGSGAIAARSGFVYVATQNSPAAVLAFTAPLRKGEAPAVSVSAGINLPVALAAGSTHLYVANQGGTGTITSYALPLRNGETPDGTVRNLHEPSGVAVRGTNLYVSRFDTAQVFVYHLAFTPREKPSVTLDTGFSWTGSLAATPADLYVDDALRSAWDFALPLHSGEHSSTSVKVYRYGGNLLAAP